MNISTENLDHLVSEAAKIEGELTKITDSIKKGASTGDKFKDLALLEFGPEYHKAMQGVEVIQRYLKGVEPGEWIGFFQTWKQGDYYLTHSYGPKHDVRKHRGTETYRSFQIGHLKKLNVNQNIPPEIPPKSDSEDVMERMIKGFSRSRALGLAKYAKVHPLILQLETYKSKETLMFSKNYHLSLAKNSGITIDARLIPYFNIDEVPTANTDIPEEMPDWSILVKGEPHRMREARIIAGQAKIIEYLNELHKKVPSDVDTLSSLYKHLGGKSK